MKNCWDIKGCPASHYMNCTAYDQMKSCWEVKSGCLCTLYSGCNECPIYNDHVKEEEK